MGEERRGGREEGEVEDVDEDLLEEAAYVYVVPGRSDGAAQEGADTTWGSRHIIIGLVDGRPMEGSIRPSVGSVGRSVATSLFFSFLFRRSLFSRLPVNACVGGPRRRRQRVGIEVGSSVLGALIYIRPARRTC
jgi:hypothetical protein